MKQLLQNLRDGETVVAEVPIPTPQQGQALVRTTASLVSAGTERMVVEFAEKSLIGKARSRPDLVRQVLDKARREGLLTTLEAAFNRLEQPMPLGYSSAGIIESLGEGMDGFHVGQRVACAGGGFAVHAEYACVPRNLLAPIPDGVDFEAAAFTTLGAIALHGFRLAEVGLGERVAVIGLGLLGLLAGAIANAAGCHVFGVDLDPGRVTLAQTLGIEAVHRSEAEAAAKGFSHGRGCDAVLICADSTSADPVELAGLIARDRANVVAVGAVSLHIPRKIYYEKELTFVNSRSYGPGRYDPGYEEGGRDYPIGYVRWTEGRNLQAFVELLERGRVDVKSLITHRFPIETAPQAYELITGRVKEPFLGVLLTYGQDEEPETGVQESEAAADQSAAAVTSEERKLGGEKLGIGDAYPVFRKVERVGLGVLGAGNFAGAVMLPALAKIDNVDLIGIVSASGMSAQHAVNRFGFRYAGSDINQILDDPDINTVAILTRHHLHARQVLAALGSKKHVFCEKPLALNEAELEEIQPALGWPAEMEASLVDSGGTTLSPDSYPLIMVGFNRRFAPLTVELKKFLAGRAEPLIAHYRVNAGYIPLNHWLHDPEQGGGRIIGEGCHFIDFLAYLVGAGPVSVSAQGLPDDGSYCEDNVQMTFHFPDGSLGTVSYLANGDKAFPKERVEVFCGGRVAVLDDYRSLETVQDGRRRTYRSRFRQDKGHRAEWKAMAAALTGGGPPPIPYDQLFGVARASFAAVRALRTGEKISL